MNLHLEAKLSLTAFSSFPALKCLEFVFSTTRDSELLSGTLCVYRNFYIRNSKLDGQ
jgi:hypothetical protein